MEEKEEQEEKEMSFLDHLEELRWHLIRSVIAVIVVASVAFVFGEFIFETIIFAPKNPDFITFRALCHLANKFNLGDALCIEGVLFEMKNFTMTGQFLTHIIVSIVIGFVVAFPYVFFEFWRFISPALKSKEKRYTVGIVFTVSALFALGITFGYFIIAPLSANFLGTYQVSEEVENLIGMRDYISTITTITLATGLVFQLPVVVYFLSKLGLISPKMMKRFRKHALVASLVLSAIITPPDVSSQILVAIPLMFLYEVSIYISRIVVKKSESK